MKLIQKCALLACVLASPMTFAQAADDMDAVESAASTGADPGRFDVSNDACYFRMKELDTIAAKGFKPWDDPRSALRAKPGDGKILGVPAGEWDQTVLAELDAALSVCTGPSSMGSVWDSSFADRVREGLPGYLNLARERIARNARFHEGSASISGASASCEALLDYADSGVSPGMPGYGNAVFGKPFTAYEDADYGFLHEKIDACIGLLEEAGVGGKDEQTAALTRLQQRIASEWPGEQEDLARQQQAAAEVSAKEDARVAEEKRRTKDPTTLERMGDYLRNVGILGFLGCIAAMPKKDRRFKSGYQRDVLPKKPLFIVFVSSIGLIVLGALIGGTWV